MSAATRPSSVLARPGAVVRVAVRERLLLRGRSSCAGSVRDRSPPAYRATVVGLRVGEPTGAPVALAIRKATLGIAAYHEMDRLLLAREVEQRALRGCMEATEVSIRVAGRLAVRAPLDLIW